MEFFAVNKLHEKNEAGFALIILLVFIGIISGVLFSMSYSVVYEAKNSENFRVYSHRIYLSDIVLEKIKRDILTENMPCLEHWCPISGEFLKNSEKVTYLLSYLQTIPCFHLKESEKPGADFFKVLVKIKSGIDELEIERTFVKSPAEEKICTDVIKDIDGGYLSWRVGSAYN